MELSAVTDELYTGGLEDFTPRRAELVKAARAEGDKALVAAIGKLRKPSRSAWAINMLTRTSADEVERLLELGAAFRQAQDDLDGDELRDLSRRRQVLIGAVVAQIRTVAGDLDHPISEAMATEIEQTLRAAMADPDAAAAVRGGALTTAISASGLGSLKISDVAASTTPVLELVRAPTQGTAAKSKRRAKSPEPTAEDGDREDEAERHERERTAQAATDQLEQAERAAAAAADRLTAAGQAVERAGERRAERRVALDDLRERLTAAEDGLATAEDDLAGAERDRETARVAAATADQAVEDARAALPT